MPATHDSPLTGVARFTGSVCMPSDTNIALTGALENGNQLTLTSDPVDGSTLTVQGILASDGSTITQATYSISGGDCGTAVKAAVVAAHYQLISGSYSGNFTDAEGDQIPVTATLTQTSQPDANGQFHLSGSATFPNSSCFTAQPIVTDSVVTGSSLSTTYTSTNGVDPAATITATGTFNAGATQLTISNWSVSGGACDGETGTGLLTLGTQD